MSAPTESTLLVTVTGHDRPGVTSALFDALSRHDMVVLDLELRFDVLDALEGGALLVGEQLCMFGLHGAECLSVRSVPSVSIS